MQVMFVDDESRVLSGIERTLALHDNDWTCRFALTGQEALASLEAVPADVVVSDMRMPLMDGAELLGYIRDRWPGTMRIILSGYVDTSASLRMLEVAHQFVAKPCDNTVLLAALERAVGLRNLFRDPRVAAAVGRTSRLPAAPKVFTEVCRLIADPGSDSRHIAALLASDPALSAKLLQLANSSYFAGSSTIHDVTHAIARLGLDQVVLLVLASQVFAEAGTDRCIDQIQRLALSASLLAGRIAGRKGGPEATAALLAHIGFLIPELRDGDLAVSSEPDSTLLHPPVGAYLLALWGLPMDIVDAVARHHCPASAGPDFGLAGMVHVAVALASDEELDMDYLESVGVAARLPEWLAHKGDMHE